MASTTKTRSALNRRRDELLAKYSPALEALAGIDATRAELDQIADKRKAAEDKALRRIRDRFDTQEADARRDLAEQLAAARDVMGARAIAKETGLTSAEQSKLLKQLDEKSDDSDDTDSSSETGAHEASADSTVDAEDKTETITDQSDSDSSMPTTGFGIGAVGE